jgi:hypothetical protein
MTKLLSGESVFGQKPESFAGFPASGHVHVQGWAGLRRIPVVVLGETAKRYRVQYGDGTVKLVPKHAVTFAVSDGEG